MSSMTFRPSFGQAFGQPFSKDSGKRSGKHSGEHSDPDSEDHSSRAFVLDSDLSAQDSPQSGLPTPTQNRWALLVGINRYVDPAFATLNFCVNDVLALEKLLKQLGYTVVCLHDNLDRDDPRFPTRDNIEAELTKLCQSVRKDDLLLVHFACHGVLIDRQPFLITQQTRHINIAKQGLPLAEVESQMRSSAASRLILTLDACHTGAEMGRDVSDPEFIRNAHELAEGFVLIAASTAQQVAQEWRSVRHGVFTYYLLEGLSGKAVRGDRAFVTVNDLQTYVLDNLRRWSIQHKGLIQEPTVRSEGLGDMILADYRSHPIPTPSQDKRQEKFRLLPNRCKPRTAALTSLGIALALGGLRFLGLMQPMELAVYDSLMRLRSSEPDSRLLIVKVTQEDLEAEQQKRSSGEVIGSFSNQTLTELLKKLEEYNPVAIGFDVYREQKIPPKYQELAKRFSTQPNLFTICKGRADSVQMSGIAPPPNVPPERVGFSDFASDPDNVLRRYLLAAQQEPTSPCTSEISFGLALANHYLKSKNWTLNNPITADKGCQDVTFEQGDRRVVFPNFLPYTGGYQGIDVLQTLGCQVLINYRGHLDTDVADTLTLTKMLNDPVDPNHRERIILIGIEHRNTNLDHWHTPFSHSEESQMPGVVVQANMISGILGGVLGDRAPVWVLPQWGEWLWILLWCGVGGGLGWWFRSPRVVAIAIVTVTVGLYVVCWVIFQTSSGWIPYMPCILGVWIAGGIIWWLNLNSSLRSVSDSD
ncbi:CHASE2 domain-containing protein [Leptolyngbya ohadii]|uniref:CHASE2 domain-containing protein n=1 Tax=Leptolyngbya ohadii TaxID=1962290 RepID=UPI000B5A08BB|nr:CHASE2 domain-containing protein [Leptolyngbya ohadii]